MPDHRQRQAVMFADVSGSSGLYKHLGNTIAKRSVDSTLETLKTLTREFRGQVVKTLGDEIMARFETAEDACRAAIAMQQALYTSGQDLAIRIGIAFGETLLDTEGDVFGDVVNDAAAVAHIARANQIVITAMAAEALGKTLRSYCQTFDQVQLKGGKISQTIYRLLWETPTQAHNATRVMSLPDMQSTLSEHSLWLTGPQAHIHITPDKTPFSLGREALRAQLVVNSARASREHCDILYRRGKYVLADHSTNGTYLLPENAREPLYIRREEAPLTGRGYLGLGQAPGPQNPHTLSFCISEAGPREDND